MKFVKRIRYFFILWVIFGVTACSKKVCGNCIALPGLSPGQVARENAILGTSDWVLAHRAKHQIEGYPLTATVRPGEAVPIAVSSDSPGASFSWVAYRMGYYQNNGARQIAAGGPVSVVPQPNCPADSGTGLVACKWGETFRVQTRPDWIDGVYLIELTRADGFESYVPFFIRDDTRAAQVVMGIPTSTWAAYNAWGSESLYNDGNNITGRGRAFKVSYDKPYLRDTGAGHLLRNERHVIKWLEAQGLDVSYATDEELDRDPNILSNAKVLVLPAHDEYWTRQIRDRIDAAVASGTSLILLGANTGYWQTRLEDAVDGRTRRVVTSYKEDAAALDPVGPQNPQLTTQFRLPPISLPENKLFGVMFSHRYNSFGFPSIISNVSHWAMQATGFSVGDTLPGAGGYEIDQVVPDANSPPNLTVLADFPALSIEGAFGHGQMVIREQGPATIFAAGGIDFANFMSSPLRADPRAQRLIANILYHALGTPVPTLVQFQPTTPSIIQTAFANSVVTVAGVAGSPGDQDGAAGSGELAAPVAVAVLPNGGFAVADASANKVKRVSADPSRSITTAASGFGALLGIAADGAGNIYVSDSLRLCIYRIDPSNRVSVIAGAPGLLGSNDGPGALARFSTLAGMSMGIDGHALLVADLGNGTIRQVDTSDPNFTVTTLSHTPLFRPSGVAQGSDGTVYVVETDSTNILTLKSGTTQILAGHSTPGYADGTAATASFLPYLGIAVLQDGSVVVSDPGNYRLRRIQGGTVTTYAGSGQFGHRDGSGGQADLVLPSGLTVDKNGKLYVADTGNGAIRLVE